MWLFFLRHGVAEEGGLHIPDESRRLTEEGRAEMQRVAAGMARLDLRLDCILSSPLIRAEETARIVAEVLDLQDKLELRNALAGGFCLGRLQGMLAPTPNAKRVLLVGHEPTLSATIGELIGGGHVHMRKAALAGVKTRLLEPGAGTLEFLLTPDILSALAG